MQPTKAILREVPNTYSRCVSSHPQHSSLNIEKAREQHRKYQETLENLGIETILLEKDDRFPDSCFVEDTAIVHKHRAVITRFGEPSRRGEEREVAEVLKEFKEVFFISEPGTIEGGDVIHLREYLISGLTERTNQNGVDQSSKFLNVPIETVKDSTIVHLKSYVTYLSRDILVSTKKYSAHPIFKPFQVIEVPPEEAYGANTLTIGDVVIISSGHPKLEKMIKEHGFETITLNMSEFEKCEGALTCLSIRF